MAEGCVVCLSTNLRELWVHPTTVSKPMDITPNFVTLTHVRSPDLSSATHLRSIATILGSKYATTYFDCQLRIVGPQNYEFGSPVQENSFRQF